MIARINTWLDANQWACWLGLAACTVIIGIIEKF